MLIVSLLSARSTVRSLAMPNCVYRIFKNDPSKKAQLIHRFRRLSDAEGWANFLNVNTSFYHEVIFNPCEED
jgi:hypothetical protein